MKRRRGLLDFDRLRKDVRRRSRRLRRRRASANGRNGTAVAAGFMGGLVAGMVVWSMQMTRSRRDLFSRSPLRRFAALGHLGGQPGLSTARLLEEYVRWEPHPLLRRRGEKLLHRMRQTLV